MTARARAGLSLIGFGVALAVAAVRAARGIERTVPARLGDACGRFEPLPAESAAAIHDPVSPDLPPPRPRREIAFRHAFHTLLLDDTVAGLIAGAGFDTAVQVFPWRDFNPEPGRYTWRSGDDMLRVARRHGLDLVIRLDMPPEWARRHGPVPFDLAAYVRFVEAMAARYRGHVLGYIIWNEPNLSAEWSRSGGSGPEHWASDEPGVADPADYAGVVGAAYTRIKAVDPQALVAAGGLAPTNEISERALDDREFLRGFYLAGAAACFDVLAVHNYGYGLSPFEARGAHDGLNLARLLDLRDIALEYGANQPMWITELGYSVEPGSQPSVSEDMQAAYLRGSFERVRREWPWVRMLTVWNISYGLPAGDEMAGFSLVRPDLRPRPAYWALAGMEKPPP